VRAWAKWLGWAFLAIYNLGLGFYIILFGIQKGASTTKAWLGAFLYSLLQDTLVAAPLTILFFFVYLPLHIKSKIQAQLDGASSEPFVFSDFLPPGPAARVVLRHPAWAEKVGERLKGFEVFPPYSRRGGLALLGLGWKRSLLS
jgi:hypothetical protein